MMKKLLIGLALLVFALNAGAEEKKETKQIIKKFRNINIIFEDAEIDDAKNILEPEVKFWFIFENPTDKGMELYLFFDSITTSDGFSGYSIGGDNHGIIPPKGKIRWFEHFRFNVPLFFTKYTYITVGIGVKAEDAIYFEIPKEQIKHITPEKENKKPIKKNDVFEELNNKTKIEDSKKSPFLRDPLKNGKE